MGFFAMIPLETRGVIGGTDGTSIWSITRAVVVLQKRNLAVTLRRRAGSYCQRKDKERTRDQEARSRRPGRAHEAGTTPEQPTGCSKSFPTHPFPAWGGGLSPAQCAPDSPLSGCQAWDKEEGSALAPEWLAKGLEKQRTTLAECPMLNATR